jgi:asparagine synthase (glutamine-hydrolysing)
MVVGDIGRITWHHDEPLGDAATINNYYLAREAKKYTTVILAGEGGDELFGGYPWYKYVPLISAMNKVPYPVRRLLSSADKLLGNGDPTRRFNKWHRMLEFPLQKSLVDMQLYPTTAMSAQNLKWLTGVDYRNNGILVPEMRDPLNKMLGLDCLNLLQKFLMKADKSTMSHAIEERLPLLDTKVIEYAFSLPPRMKRDKYALRKAVEDLLPKDITWRKKQGFGTPLAHWLNSPKMRALAIDRLHGDFLIDICNHDALYNLAAMLKNGGLKHSNIAAFGAANVIWSLLALQVWYDIFFWRIILNNKTKTILTWIGIVLLVMTIIVVVTLGYCYFTVPKIPLPYK